ncbi:MAG: DUF1450 domain-containing protein [Sporolactobacillus sp.]
MYKEPAEKPTLYISPSRKKLIEMSHGIGLVLVELCDYNQLTEDDLMELQDYAEVGIMHCDCLNICGMCSRRPFALVNGSRVFAETPAACAAKIKAKVIQELQQFID